MINGHPDIVSDQLATPRNSTSRLDFARNGASTSLALALSFSLLRMAVSRPSSTGSFAQLNSFSPQNTYSLTDRVVLKNDPSKIAIPRFGLGVYVTEPGAETQNAVRWALEAGYRVSAACM